MINCRNIAFGAAIGLLATSSAFAQSALSEALGGPFLECSGTIVWAAESEGGKTREEPMRIAALDDPGANEIALYVDRENFLPDDVWLCSSGFCSSYRAMPSGVTTSVIRLSKAPDTDDGRAAYVLAAVFSVVSASEGGLSSATAFGNGPFVCEKALPGGVTAPGNAPG